MDSGVAIQALFTAQAQECRKLGSPFTARILDRVIGLIDPASPLAPRLLGATALPEQAIPLRLAGALHAMARAGDADLSPVYPPHDASDARLDQALARALALRADVLLPWLDQPPQTNEVARSAVLIAVGHWLTARFGLPLHLSELGASAGLNLWWDRYAMRLGDRLYGPPDAPLTLTPDWTGELPPLASPRITGRAGVDLYPLDPGRDRDRLQAYLWADQTQRADRCALALSHAAAQDLRVSRGDAADFAAQRLDTAPEGALHLVFHTIAAKYFSASTTRHLARVLKKAGARATPNRPLAHLSMEYDGPTPGAALTLTLWPGGQVLQLGRADFHGRWVQWQAPDLTQNAR
jgi:hypothetical protein